MFVWFDIQSEPFFAQSVAMLQPPANSSVILTLMRIQQSNVPFQDFASAFNWRQIVIPPIDTFPGNDDALYRFDIQTGGNVTVISARWDGGAGVQCLTAM